MKDWPRLTLGYERQSRVGAKSPLEWGSVQQGDTERKIFPSFKDINERVDIFKASVDHQLGLGHSNGHVELDRQRDGSRCHEIIRVDRFSARVLAELEPLRARFGNDSLERCPAQSASAALGRSRPLSKTQAWLPPEDCWFSAVLADGSDGNLKRRIRCSRRPSQANAK